MARKVDGQVLVVTGASAGIGEATAIEAARHGMRVAVAARRIDRLEAVANRIREIGSDALVVPTDVSDRQQVKALVEQTVEHFGRLDVMFANAGYNFFSPDAEVSERAEREIFDVNYFGAVRCVRAAVPFMQRCGGGHLIINSSIVAKVGLPYYAPYAATKGALSSFASSLRLELEPDQIYVSTLYPIGTRTELFEVSARLSGCDALSENTPIILFQSPRHVARRVVRSIQRPTPEIWPSRLGHLGAVIWTALPRFQRFCFRFPARTARRSLRARSAASEGDGNRAVTVERNC